MARHKAWQRHPQLATFISSKSIIPDNREELPNDTANAGGVPKKTSNSSTSKWKNDRDYRYQRLHR